MTSVIEKTQQAIDTYSSKIDTRTNNQKKQETNDYLINDAALGNDNPFPDGAFEIGKDTDNTTKYTFDSIYQDQNLIKVAQDYYENRDGIRYDAEDAIDEFISDRTWKQSNTLSMMDELNYVLSNETDVQQKQRLSYLMQYWSQLPNFYQEGGRGWWDGISSNVLRGMADPLNYVGGIFGGQLVKQGVKKAGQELLKKSVNKKVVRDAAIKGTGLAVATDATIFGGADAILQKTEMEVGMRDKYDPTRTAYSAIIGAGTTIVPTGVSNYFLATKGAKSGVAKLGGEVIDDLEVVGKTGVKDVDKLIAEKGSTTRVKSKDPFDKTEKVRTFTDRYNTKKQQIFDKYNPIRVTQEKLTGVEGSVEGLKKAYKNPNQKFDPVTNPYFQFRMLVGSNPRADNFAKEGVKLMADINAKEFNYTPTGNKGFLQVLKPFNDNGHADTLLTYIGALRSNKIRQNAVDIPVGKKQRAYLSNAMFTQSEADKIIKFAEETNDTGLDFIKGAKDIKKFFDDILKYQKKAGQLDDVQLKAIQKKHPFYIPFYSEVGASTKVDLHSDAISRRVSGIGSPARKRLQTDTVLTKSGFKPLFESSLDYIYTAVKSADLNVAKRTLYRMIEDGEKKGVIEKGSIVKELNKAQIKSVRGVITKSAIEKLKEMGVKVDDASLDPDNISFSTMAFADNIIDKANAAGQGSNKKIDIFYDKGKLRAFVVQDDEMFNFATGMDNHFLNFFQKLSKFTEPFARIPATAITYSPPFLAYNFMRDTLSGAVNSAFGFIPVASTLKGGYKTMKGIGNPKNVKEYRAMYARNDDYRKALVSGMGYSSRLDTEKYLKFGNKFSKHGTSPANAFYKKSLRNLHKLITGTADGYGRFVSKVEYATRMAEFEFAKKAGFSDVGAAFAAREVATDFGMSGSSGFLNVYARNTMFFNAGLQGFYRGLRRAKENKTKFGMMVGGVIVAPEIALWTLNNARPEYDEVPEEVKQLNYLIPFFADEQPDGSHKHRNGMRKIDYFIAIPKPYDFGIFANIATGILESVQENSSPLGAQYIFKSFNQIMPGSGFYRGGEGGMNVFGIPVPFLEEPTVFRPWADLFANHDWTGANITPYGLEKLPPHMRIKTNTRESIIQFAQFMNELTSPSGSNRSFLTNTALTATGGAVTGAGMGYSVAGAKGAAVGAVGGAVVGAASKILINPVELDHLMSSYFTGLLSYPFDIADAYAWKEDKFGERVLRRTDESDITKAPWSVITRRFNVKIPVKSSENVRILYDIKKKADEVMATDFEMNKSLRFLLDVTNLENNYKDETLMQFRGVSPYLEEVLRKLAESREIRNNIRFMKNLSAEDKRKQIDELIETENLIAYNMLKTLADADLDGVMKDKVFNSNKYNLPKEKQTEIPIISDVTRFLTGLEKGE